MGVTAGRSASEPFTASANGRGTATRTHSGQADDGATKCPPREDGKGDGLTGLTGCTHPTRQRHIAGSPLKHRRPHRRCGESGASPGRSKRALDVAIGH